MAEETEAKRKDRGSFAPSTRALPCSQYSVKAVAEWFNSCFCEDALVHVSCASGWHT